MSHDPFLAADVFAVLGVVCLACALAFVALIYFDLRQQDRRAAEREQRRADWSAGRKAGL